MFTMIRGRDGSLSFRLQKPPGLLSPDEVEHVLFALVPVLVELVEAREGLDGPASDATAITLVASLRRPSEPMWELWASLLLENERRRLRRIDAPAEAVHSRMLEMSHAVWLRLVECDLPREETVRLAQLARARLREELLGLVAEDVDPRPWCSGS